MKWAAANEAGRASERADSERRRAQKTLSVLFLRSFRSSKLTPQPPCIFHDPCWLTSSLSSLSLSLSSPLTFCSNTQTGSNTHHHTLFHSQLSYLPNPSKTISLTNSPPNAEWHFTLRRQRGPRDAELDEREEKMRLNESKASLLRAPQFSSSIIAERVMGLQRGIRLSVVLSLLFNQTYRKKNVHVIYWFKIQDSKDFIVYHEVTENLLW